jgi:enediyne biosynthesis protein E4
MGVDAEDVSGDGLPELFATNFENDYNTLYRNLDGRSFQDVSASAGIVKDSLPYVGWGCALADLDNDGLPDMFVVNGHVDDNLPQLGRPIPQAEPAMVWRNQGKGRFRLVRDPGPFFAARHVARGAAFGDLDNDGDLDVVISRMDSGPAVLLNESETGRWLGLELVGTRSNRSAIGALIAVSAGGRILHRQVKGGGSYLSANDPRILVGVGAADRVDEVLIRWPSGMRSNVAGLELGRYHRIVEPDGDPVLRGGKGQ